MRNNDFSWRFVASARQSALFPFRNQDPGSRGNRTRRRIRQSGRFLGLAPAAAMSISPSIDVARQALRVKNFVQATPVYAILFVLGQAPGVPGDSRSV